MCLFAPTAEAVVGNHNINAVVFNYCLNGFVVSSELFQCSWERGYHLESLGVGLAVSWFEAWKFYKLQVWKSFLKKSQRTFVGCDNNPVALPGQGFDYWYTAGCMAETPI